MSYRPTWQGHLKLSLVTCPVSLYTATNAASDVHFHLINPDTNNRVKMISTDPETGPVERAKLVRGYEVEKGRYLLLTDEELQSVKLESTRTIDIEQFVPAADIDRIYWDHPYYLAPDGKMAQEAFGVIREAMHRSGQIALGRIVLSTRERMLALEPRGRGILAYSLRTSDEIRAADEIFESISSAKLDASMITIAEKIMQQREAKFDPDTFTDRYERALKDMIAAKLKGQKPVAAAEPEQTNVVDLMAALRASLEGRGQAESRAAKAKKADAPKRKSRRSA